MRSGLLTLGAFLLVVSALFFYIPWTTATAQAINTGEAESLSTPRYWALGGMVTGAFLAILGLLMPDPNPVRLMPPQSYASSGPLARKRSR